MSPVSRGTVEFGRSIQQNSKLGSTTRSDFRATPQLLMKFNIIADFILLIFVALLLILIAKAFFNSLKSMIMR